MHAGGEDAVEALFADTPVLGEADVLPGFGVIAGLQPAGCGQQGELGAVGVVLQSVAVQLGEALPVAKLPLRACAFEQDFVVGDGVAALLRFFGDFPLSRWGSYPLPTSAWS
jgi:hypothetical protein